ncbi:hypothetical protein LCGC14_2513280 [marine sediment metagenome]|uniref:Uncharacterized protein n=1 Tax=marine sediment metagenome TaxID=412755 RepID=A0A0F9DRW6_9ZZZZ
MTIATENVCPAGGQHESIVTADYRTEMGGTWGGELTFRVWLKSILSFWDSVVKGKEETQERKSFSITLCRKCSTLFGVAK